jgi:hypothetical protein
MQARLHALTAMCWDKYVLIARLEIQPSSNFPTLQVHNGISV